MIQCIGCSGSGKCRTCKGTLTTSAAQTPCPGCNGTGSVLSKTRAAAATTSYESDTARAPARPSFSKKKLTATDIESSLSDYVNTMSSLNKQNKDGKHTKADFGTLMANPGKYKGRLVRSEVSLLHAHARAVRVQGLSGAGSAGPKALVPYSQKVGSKSVQVMDQVGQKGRVFITYGVVNPDNVTLFGIDVP